MTSRSPLRVRRPPRGRQQSIEGRRTFAIALLTVAIVAAAASAWADVGVLHFLGGIPSDGFDPVADPAAQTRADALDARTAWTARLSVGALVLCAVAFLMWFHRGHANLRATGPRNAEFTPGWACGSFFVPIVSLFIPCQAMGALWRGSAALAGDPAAERPRRPRTSPMVLVWWFLFISSRLTYVVGVALTPASKGVASLVSTTRWTLAGDLLEIAAGLAAIYLVVKISEMQVRAAEVHVADVFD